MNRGSNYNEPELTALLLAWADPDIQAELSGLTRNKAVFEKLADRLVEAGFPRRSGQACRDKINRVKASYRAIRDEGRKSGSGKQEEPFWFEIVDGILGTKPATCPVASFDSGSTPSAESTPMMLDPPDDLLHDEGLTTEDVTSEEQDFACASSSASGSEVAQRCDLEVLPDGTQDPDESIAGPSSPSLVLLQDGIKDPESLAGPRNPSKDAQPDGSTPEELDSSLEDQGSKKGKKKVLKRKADTKTRLVSALQTSHNEVKEQMQEMEKRQHLADEKVMERELQLRERDWQRKKELEERRRNEDRELAREERRESREFNIALMSLLERQTNMMARMMGDVQSFSNIQHMNYRGPEHHAPQYNAPQPWPQYRAPTPQIPEMENLQQSQSTDKEYVDL